MLYFLKRLLLFIPTLLILSLLFFYLSKVSAGDPMLNKIEKHNDASFDTKEELKAHKKLRKKNGLDLADFYFSVYRKTSSDTIQRIENEKIRINIISWSYEITSWEKVNELHKRLKAILSDQSVPIPFKKQLYEQLGNASLSELKDFLATENVNKPASLVSLFSDLKMNEEKGWWNNYLLKFKWHGKNNQYHRWLSSLLIGDLGTSYIDGRTVSSKIGEAIQWTLTLSISALILALLFAIPLASYTALNPESVFSKTLSFILLGLYSIPNFWLATLLIIFLAGGEYLSIFPSYGPGIINEDDSFFSFLQIRISHLFLPVVCISYGSLAYLYKQVNNSMRKELSSQYIQTAYSKGLQPHIVIWKHAFRNASLPLITILGRALPALISGSFIIEFIFSIQGMGKLTIESFFARDYPVIFGILMIASALTLLGAWLADIFYQYADPRISIGTKDNSKI